MVAHDVLQLETTHFCADSAVAWWWLSALAVLLLDVARVVGWFDVSSTTCLPFQSCTRAMMDILAMEILRWIGTYCWLQHTSVACKSSC